MKLKFILSYILVFVCLNIKAGTPLKTQIVGELIHVFDPTVNDPRLGATFQVKDMEEGDEDNIVKSLKKIQYKRSLNEKEIVEQNTSNKADVQGFKRGKLFEANAYNGGTPSDNALALSNKGFFVSAINSTVDFYDSTGKRLVSKSLSSFANDASLSFTFDPKVLFDPENQRFILVFLNGNTPNTSKVIVAFSTTDDPRNKWNVYKLTGNPLKDNSWTDYPNIGVSKEDFFITTNLFTVNNSFSQAIIQQIPKKDGFDGAPSLKVLIWNDLIDDNNESILGIYPLMGGQSNLYSSGMYFAATQRGSGNYFTIAKITGDYSASNNQIIYNSYNCGNYQVGRDAAMKSNSDPLSVGDCRVKGGFQLNNNLYFVFSATFGLDIWSNVVYIKFNIVDKTFKLARIAKQFESFCYPNIASFATDEYDETVAICYTASSNKYFPEARTIVCDSWMQFSEVDTFKRGDTYIDALGTGTDERWGDYSGIARWHNKPYRSVWAFNMVGQILPNSTRRIGNWICEVRSNTPSYQGLESEISHTDGYSIYPNPVSNEYITIDFNVKKTQDLLVQLYDIQGKLVNTLAEQKMIPGSYNFRMNVANLPSGNYFVNIYSSNRIIKTQKIVKQ